MKLRELHYVPVLSDGDLNGGATLSGDSINMANFHECLFLVGLQTLAGADSHIKVFSGATAGAKTSALTFAYAFGGAATGSAGADVYTWSTSADLALTHGTYDNYLLLIQIDAKAMDLANGENWLTIELSDPDTGSTGNAQINAIVTPRYAPAGTAI